MELGACDVARLHRGDDLAAMVGHRNDACRVVRCGGVRMHEVGVGAVVDAGQNVRVEIAKTDDEGCTYDVTWE